LRQRPELLATLNLSAQDYAFLASEGWRSADSIQGSSVGQ